MRKEEFIERMESAMKACEDLVVDDEGRTLFIVAGIDDLSTLAVAGTRENLAECFVNAMLHDDVIFTVLDASVREAWRIKAEELNPNITNNNFKS